jgi:uncharacterized protein YjaZ
MKDLRKFIKITIREFLNEQNNNYITLYHGGYIDKLYSPIYLTEDYYMAKSYDNNVYTFLLDKNSNILDLTNLNTFQEIKKKIYDNYSKNYLKYKTFGGFGLETKDRIEKNYSILKQYKNYNEIENRYKELLNIDFVKNIWTEHYYDRIDNLILFYKNASDDERKIIDELEILDNENRNMNKQDDYSLNMFGKYFQDYSKINGYDGYKAISTYLDGKTKGVEYCIININKLKQK